MQLDLFMHSRDVELRNDVIAALRRRDAGEAQTALTALCAEYPRDPLLQPARALLEALNAPAQRHANHREAAEALRVMEADVVPAAAEVFGDRDARCWLAPLWRSRAQAAELPYDQHFPDAHAAGLFLRSGDWAAAAECVAGIASWRRIPAPLAWMAEARFAQGGLEAAFGLMAELAWIDAPRLAALARRLAAPLLERLLEDFDAGFEPRDEADLAWFPAWALAVEPGLALAFRDAQARGHGAPERAARLVAELLALERQGRHGELVAQRRRLRELAPALFARYMGTR